MGRTNRRGRTDRGVTAALAVLIGMVVGASAGAEPLAPGETLNVGGTTLAVSPWLQGDSLGGAVLPFSISDQFGAVLMTGTLLVSYVDAEPFARRYAAMRIQGLNGLPGRSVRKIEFAGWGVNSVEAEFRADLDPLGVVPQQAIRSADGDTVTFTFPAGVIAPLNSRFVYVFTSTPNVEPTGTARIVLNTGESATVTGVPVPAAPPTPPVCTGDTNGDGVVNFADLNGVLSNFGDECD